MASGEIAAPSSDDELVREFLTESVEGLDALERELVALEEDPSDSKRIATIFRTMHTIKGTSGFLGLKRLEALTHAAETLLTKIRDGAMMLDAEIASGLLASVDASRKMLAEVAANGTDGTADHAPLLARLAELAVPGSKDKRAAKAVTKVASKQVEAPALAAVAAAAPAPPSKPQSVELAPIAETSVRVDVGLLDNLMNLVGELVLARNQIVQGLTGAESQAIATASERLNFLTSELQEGVMKTRMQPIDSVWNKFPRVVRDLSKACGKRVAVEMIGRETELDRTLIEAIRDPLTHVVRNSVDHGVESPEARRAVGKPEQGKLTLRAYHEGGQVHIEIADDGAGIDPERVRRKAIERGIVSADEAAQMSPRQIFGLIFLPGFSTRDAVTSVSGRGVGMDVVKTNIERVGGTVDVQSVLGSGTTLRIRIPLTLTIVPALIVSCAGDRYAIPQVSLLELVRLEGEQLSRGVESIRGTLVHRLRGSLLPLVRLDELLGTAPPRSREFSSRDLPEGVSIVVLRIEDQQLGLIVDAVHDTEEIVVKPLGRLLRHVRVFAGATIMGDGHVALILDVPGLARSSNVQNAVRRTKTEACAIEQGADKGPPSTLLIVGLPSRRLAIPLTHVTRLEYVPASQVEQVGARRVLQYRGALLPLSDLGEVVAGVPAPADGRPVLPVVVCSSDGRQVGLIVHRIVDIVEEHVVLERWDVARGIVGVGVVQGRVTEVVDVEGLLRSALPPLRAA
jgi:two-component system chemotaxis sensor kinase CheA